MSAQSVAGWARTTDFDVPVRLGEIEAHVLAQPVDEAPVARPAGTAWVAAVVAALLLVGPGVVGLIALWTATQAAPGEAGLGLEVSRAAYLVAAIMPLALLAMWGAVYGRHRTALEVPAAAVAAVSAVAGLIVAAVTATELPAVLLVRMILAAVSGLVCLVVLLVASKPGPPPLFAAGAGDADPADRARLRDRTLVAHVLRERGLIDADTYQRALSLPLGRWHELDPPAQP